ncbi:complement factor H isoform 2-T2 [Pholidichthys leucotaenia]
MEVLLSSCVQSLLLVLVVKAAADCPRPQAGERMVLSTAALQMSDFVEGTEVALVCANGYEVESGSGIIKCISDRWTASDLICKMKDCGVPKPQPNMNFDLSGGTLFKALARATCDKGYQIIGTSFKQCYAVGWVGRAKCEIVQCEIPHQIDNGRSLWDVQGQPKYGESVQYSCDPGYTLIGNDSITCTETGKYNAQPPQCTGVTTETAATSTPTQVFHTTGPPTSSDSSVTPTAQRDKTITASTTPAVSHSRQGDEGILRLKEIASTPREASTISFTFQGIDDGPVDTNKDTGNTPVIVSVIVVVLVVCIVAAFLYRILHRRKGSYDTKEDLKPELLKFQTI